MAGGAVPFTDNWPDKLGRLRPWDLEQAHKEAAAFAGASLSALVATFSQKVSAKLPSPLTPADIDDVMMIAADLSAILRDIPNAGTIIREIKSPSPGWRLVSLALQGRSYADLMRELELKPVAPKKHTSAPIKKRNTPKSVGEMIALAAKRTAVLVRDFGSHPMDGLPVTMFAGPKSYFIRHGDVVAFVAKDRDPASFTWVEVNALLAQREMRMDAKTAIALQRAYGKKAKFQVGKSARRRGKAASTKAARTAVGKDK